MIVPADESSLHQVAEILNSGGVAVIPTDTVYGLAASPRFPEAVNRLYTIKGREEGKPIAFLAADVKSTGIKSELTQHWPGALTIVSGGVGYRVPNHDWTRKLISACGGLLKVTSANLSGRRPATDAPTALKEIGLSCDIIVDDGISAGGIPSTVVKINDDGTIKILREGGIKL